MKKKIFTMLLICSTLFVAACGSSADNKKAKLSNPTTFEQTGYSIDIPDTWTKTSNDNVDLAFSYIGSKDSKFTENITTIVHDISSSDYSLDEYKNLSVSSYEEMGYKIQKCTKTNIDNIDAYLITSIANDENTDIYCKQLFTIKNKKAYIFTFAAQKKSYEKLDDEIDSIFSTIKFNNKVMTESQMD